MRERAFGDALCSGSLPAHFIRLIPLAVVVLLAPLGAQTRTIGSVSGIDDHGSWLVYPDADSSHGRKLQLWQDVPAGGVIRIKSPKPGDHLAIVDTNLKPLVAKTCESERSCTEPIFLPREQQEAPGAMLSFFRKVLARLSAEPYEPSMHRVRAGGLRLDEGVVPLVNRRIDLLKIMQHVPLGSYTLASFDAPIRPQAASGALTFQWNGQTAPVPVGTRKPGLYEISLVRAVDADSPVLAASVRVLICAPEDNAEISSSFQQAETLTKQWVEPSSTATHSFLRAYLAELAKISGKP